MPNSNAYMRDYMKRRRLQKGNTYYNNNKTKLLKKCVCIFCDKEVSFMNIKRHVKNCKCNMLLESRF